MLSDLQADNVRLSAELESFADLARTDRDLADILEQLVIVLDPIKETLPRSAQRWLDIYHNYCQEIIDEPFN